MIALTGPVSLVLAAAITAVVLTILLASQLARRVILWGPIVGLLFGFLFVAPRLLRVHHLQPETVWHWITIDAWLAAAFAGLGLGLIIIPGLLLGAVSLLVRRWLPSDMTSASLLCAASLPIAYLALSGLVEWVNFARPPATNNYVATAIAGALAISAGCVSVVVRLVRRGVQVRGTRVLALAAGLTVVSILVLPVRLGLPDRPAAIEVPNLDKLAGAPVAPLLVIGFDGGNWRTLRPVIDSGKAPHFAALLNTGIHGSVRALWPPYWSTPAWGAILTGYDNDAIGVHEDLAASADGLPPFELPLTLDFLLNPMFAAEFVLINRNIIEPTPVPRNRLARPLVWERLTKAGQRTAVIRLPFTFPATGQASYVVSNRVVTDLWDMVGVERGASGQLVAPADRAEELLAWFSSPDRVDKELSARVMGTRDWPKPRDAVVNPEDVLKRVLDISQRMFGIAERLVREDPSLDIVLFHMSSFDNICHAFWQYRFPDDFPDERPSEEDIRVLGPVVDRYLAYLDSRLGALVRAFPTKPNVLIVSDHGAEASRDYPLWKGWHGPEGLFIASGPDVPGSSQPIDVSYFDITPTIIDLQGFTVPADLTGRSVIRGQNNQQGRVPSAGITTVRRR